MILRAKKIVASFESSLILKIKGTNKSKPIFWSDLPVTPDRSLEVTPKDRASLGCAARVGIEK